MKDYKKGSVVDNKYRIINLIGQGGMGKVYKVKYSGKIYALKIVDKNKSNQYELQEAHYAYELDNKNLLDIIKITNEKNGLSYILMQYIKKGYDLNKYLEDLRNKTIEHSIDQALFIIEGIANGLKYLHEEKRYVHRDIKPSNILLETIETKYHDKSSKKQTINKLPKVNEFFRRMKNNLSKDNHLIVDSYHALIGDFGVIREMDEEGNIKKNRVKREDVFSPKELIKGATITKKVDIYGLGAIAFELLSQKRFKKEYSVKKDISKFFNNSINKDLITLIQESINDNPEERPDAKDFISCINNIKSKQPEQLIDTLILDETINETTKKKSTIISEQKKTKQVVKPKRRNKIPEKHIDTFDEKYSFDVEIKAGESRKFFFTLNQDYKPIKLGDGTFGVVFCVHEYDNVKENEIELLKFKGRYAVKIFYKMGNSQEDFDKDAQVRFDFESTFVAQIEDKLNKLGKGNYFNRLLSNIGRTENLKISCSGTEIENMIDSGSNDNKEEVRRLTVEDFNRCIDSNNNNGLTKESEENLDINYSNIDNDNDKKNIDSKNDSLCRYFSESKLNISNYAIVMDVFDYTLKELLETGIGTYTIRRSSAMKLFPKIPWSLEPLIGSLSLKKEDIESEIDSIEEIDDDKKKIELKKLISECNGYDILMNYDFETRFKTILTYAFPIAEGLRALNYTDNYHLDLKPANIFVRKKSKTIETVIGDFGFLHPSEIRATSIATVHNLLPLGTRHYRSHEQRDYFDICDVEVSSYDKCIVARDPKFQKSIIEEGDVLIFSKDINKTLYTIKKIVPYPDRKKIFINETNGILQKHDQSTQVIFFKKQATRTDLFGFGAIIFDMLTGGKSPELFYDNIKPFDTEDNSIEDIMTHYDEVKNHIPTDHIYVNAFEPFKNLDDDTYAPSEIVEVILKCMMYKVIGTYYHKSKGSDLNATELLMNEIQKFHDNKLYPVDFINNILYDLVIEDNAGIKTEEKLKDTIKGLNQPNIINKPVNYVKRLALGINYLQKLVDLIKRITLVEKEHYLIQLTPDNVKWTKSNNALSFGPSVYKEIDDYIKDLKENKAYSKFQRDVKNSYIPRMVLHMRRNIEIDKISKEEFEYKFLDGLISENIQNGDWILAYNELFKVRCLDPSKKTIHLKDHKIFSGDNFNGNFIYYHNIDPCRYYLEILSSYIYNIFFEGIDNNICQRPIITETYWHLALLSNNWDVIKLIPDTKGARSQDKRVNKFKRIITEFQAELDEFKLQPFENKFYIVHLCIVYLYIKLHFSLCNFSIYSQKESDKDRILYVFDYVTNLRKMLEKTLNCEGLLDTTKQDINNYFQNNNYDMNITDSMLNTSFNEYIRMLVRVQPYI